MVTRNRSPIGQDLEGRRGNRLGASGRRLRAQASIHEPEKPTRRQRLGDHRGPGSTEGAPAGNRKQIEGHVGGQAERKDPRGGGLPVQRSGEEGGDESEIERENGEKENTEHGRRITI